MPMSLHKYQPPPQSSAPISSSRPPIYLQYSRKRHRSGCPTPYDAVHIPILDQEINIHPPVQKRVTRDLPNLSECHACGFRIDINKGCHGKNNKLQLLYSEWRVVLLCKNCYTRVESSDICPYCFLAFKSSLEHVDYFFCRGCKHKVHKSCYHEYKNVAPWSYCCSGERDFSVCLDCWVPKALTVGSKSYSVLKRNLKIKKKVEKSNLQENLRISASEAELSGRNVVTRNLLEESQEVVKDANCAAKKKTELAPRARQTALMKGVMARKVIEFAGNQAQSVGKRDDNGACKDGGVDDDAELAMKLHRSMNSSPRISRNSCTLNSSCLAVPLVQKSDRDCPSDPSIYEKQEFCSNGKTHGNTDKDPACESSLCVRASDRDSSTDLDYVKQERVADAIANVENVEFCTKCDGEGENVDVPLKEGEGSCSNKLIISNGDDHSMDVESQSRKRQDGSVTLNHEGDSKKPDRFSIKYTKRRLNIKSSRCGRQDFLYRGFLKCRGGFGAAKLLNSSDESQTLSTASCHGSVIPLQTYARRSSQNHVQRRCVLQNFL